MVMNFELSNGTSYFTPCGKNLASSAIRVLTACAVASALPVGESCTPMPVEGLPFRRADVP